MKKRKQKIEEAEALQKELATVSTVILSTFQGITVAEDSQLRRAVQAAGGRYRVVKNRMAERAAAGTPAESGSPTAVGLGSAARMQLASAQQSRSARRGPWCGGVTVVDLAADTVLRKVACSSWLRDGRV